MNELLEIINIVLANRGKKTIERLQPDMNLRNDIGFDSLDLAELTVRIEVKYDIDIFANGLVSTVGEITEKLAKLE